jgi:hypothetical protein
MGCKCLTTNEDENREIYKSSDDDIYLKYIKIIIKIIKEIQMKIMMMKMI